VTLLNSSQVLIHPFVIGELACGNPANRGEVLGLLKDLPSVQLASDDEVLHFIEQQSLMGQGIGHIDVHLLAAVALENGASLWTRDVRLQKTARKMTLAWRKK